MTDSKRIATAEKTIRKATYQTHAWLCQAWGTRLTPIKISQPVVQWLFEAGDWPIGECYRLFTPTVPYPLESGVNVHHYFEAPK